ncbi:MAG: hypothetical protein GTO63_11060 [Anaerolineae bacterium]|nr:hypothetical protein [Anaerolineae bacterium]
MSAQGVLRRDSQRLSLYRFRHILFQRYLYSSLDPVERVHLHQAVGTALEALYGEGAEEITVQLARHFQEAGIAEKATEYLLRAGDQARMAYAHEEAIDYYERALGFLKEQREHERAARTLMKLGLTYNLAFDFRQARQAYEEGLVLWQRAGEIGATVSPPPVPHALRVAWDDPLTLDPTMAVDLYSICVIGQLFSGLVKFSPEMGIVPEVARTWEVSEGGRKYVFHLRDDVHWSDGTPVTAEDFAYTWRRVLDPAIGSPAAGLLYDIKGARAFHQGDVSDPGYVGVQALDEHTLVVELEEPTGYFLQVLGRASYPVPRHVVEAHGEAWTEVENIVTNGPFRLESWQRGQSMTLVRNPEYRGRFTGNVQQIELALEWSAAQELYEADSLDVSDLRFFPPPEVDRARQRHAGEYLPGPWLTTIFVAFNVSRPPFNDVRVRRAFVLATDKEALANVVVGDYASPATGGLVPPGMPGHSAGIGLPYDPEQARRLLAEAGYPGGWGFPGVGALTPHEREPLSKCLQAQWQGNLGVEITWQAMEHGTYIDRLYREPWSVNLGRWIADYPDPDNFLRASPWRVNTAWQDEAYDGLVEGARRVMDQGERMRMYQQADRILVEEAPILPLLYDCYHLLVKPWVRKYPTWAISWWPWKDIIIEPH